MCDNTYRAKQQQSKQEKTASSLPASLVGLDLDPRPERHALDLIDVEAVGLDPDQRLQLQPALLQRPVAVLGLGQLHLQPLDALHQVGRLPLQLQVHVVQHQLHVGPLLPLLDLQLAGGQRALLGRDRLLQDPDALLHLAQLDRGLQQLLLQDLLGPLDLADPPLEGPVCQVLLGPQVGRDVGQDPVHVRLEAAGALELTVGQLEVLLRVLLPDGGCEDVGLGRRVAGDAPLLVRARHLEVGGLLVDVQGGVLVPEVLLQDVLALLQLAQLLVELEPRLAEQDLRVLDGVVLEFEVLLHVVLDAVIALALVPVCQTLLYHAQRLLGS